MLIPSKYVSADHVPPFGLGLFLACMAVGVIEETCKFLPSALYLYRKRFFNEHTDGVIYFAIAGLGFGLPENILYSLEFGTRVGFSRVILTPFFHAAMTGLVGYFLIRVKLDRRPKITGALALAAAVGIHGVYDFGLMSGKGWLEVLSVCITLSATVMLFMLYRRSTGEDQDQGLSVVGNNSFCRSCGFANPKRKLYCQQCGKHA